MKCGEFKEAPAVVEQHHQRSAVCGKPKRFFWLRDGERKSFCPGGSSNLYGGWDSEQPDAPFQILRLLYFQRDLVLGDVVRIVQVKLRRSCSVNQLRKKLGDVGACGFLLSLC